MISLLNFVTDNVNHQRSNFLSFCFQLSSNKCSARTMDEDVTRLSIHSEEPKIILHGSGNYHACINHFSNLCVTESLYVSVVINVIQLW